MVKNLSILLDSLEVGGGAAHLHLRLGWGWGWDVLGCSLLYM